MNVMTTGEDGHLLRALDRAVGQARERRGRGLNALFPTLSEEATEMLGEVPADYIPGGYLPGPSDEEHGTGVGPVMARLRAREQARDRVREYVRTVDEGYGKDDIVDTVYPIGGCGVDGVDLRLSDLRTLAGAPRSREQHDD